jgi:predicted glycogen debranching enzyme
MWFIQATKSYWQYTGDLNFVREMLPVLRRIIDAYQNGTSYERFGNKQTIKMDENDALIVSPPQATWMDAAPSGTSKTIVTPRNGKAVEIDALWYDNIRFLATLERQEKNLLKAKDYDSLADNIKKSFNSKFWNWSENALMDVIEGDPHGGAARPNMVLAVSHGRDLLPENRQIGVVESAKKDLLTPGGLRTLSPRDSQYRGIYDTYQPMNKKDLAYHQGTAWPWLIGPYCDAQVTVRQHQVESTASIREEIARVIGPLARFCVGSPSRSLLKHGVLQVLRIIDKHNIMEEKRSPKSVLPKNL